MVTKGMTRKIRPRVPRARSVPGKRKTVVAGADQERSALDHLFVETVSLFHCLKSAAGKVHRKGKVNVREPGLLKHLDRRGVQTVPQLARARQVSRQYVQTQVNRFAEKGLVELVANPAHRRSPLVRLTGKGKDFVDAVNRRETELYEKLGVDIPERDLRNAATVLRAVRELLESDRWRQLLQNK
jgi:DNA-binding MarR family transcriptional regulator